MGHTKEQVSLEILTDRGIPGGTGTRFCTSAFLFLGTSLPPKVESFTTSVALPPMFMPPPPKLEGNTRFLQKYVPSMVIVSLGPVNAWYPPPRYSAVLFSK